MIVLCSQVLQYREQCSGLEGHLQAEVNASERDQEALLSSLRELEKRVVSLQREGLEARETHHEELRAAVERAEEQQQRCEISSKPVHTNVLLASTLCCNTAQSSALYSNINYM